MAENKEDCGAIIGQLLDDLQSGLEMDVCAASAKDGGYCIKFNSKNLPPICPEPEKQPSKEEIMDDLANCVDGCDEEVEEEEAEEEVVECEKPQAPNPFEGMDRSYEHEKALLILVTGEPADLTSLSTEVQFLTRHLGLAVRYNGMVH